MFGMKTSLLEIALSDIRENPVALRNVNRTSETYLGLVDSIRNKGVLNAIVVREVSDPETGKKLYGLIDGLHRFTASGDAGRKTIPAQVIEASDAEVLEAQIIANVQKVETKPVEYSRQLVRVLTQNPLLTLAELAGRLSKSPTWLTERLGLTKLSDDIAKLVDGNEMNLANAYALAKLPPEEQTNFVDRALTMTPQEFIGTASARVKEIRDAKRQGRDAAPAGFVAVPHVRKIGELKSEFEAPVVGPILIRELHVKDPAQAFNLGVAWALHMDAASQEESKKKDEARKAELKAQKEKRDKEREQKKADEAAKTAAELREKLGQPA
jgi:ParB/RepB/Spo0J family partition protein